MRIKVKGFLTFRKVIGKNGELEMDLDTATVRDLLMMLPDQCGERLKGMLIDSGTNELKKENLIVVDGRSSRLLLNGLDTPLEDGSMVAIFPPMAGG